MLSDRVRNQNMFTVVRLSKHSEGGSRDREEMEDEGRGRTLFKNGVYINNSLCWETFIVLHSERSSNRAKTISPLHS